MLIQLASPFIPLQHIKNGVLGIKGHTCVFPQDVKGFATVLPRVPSEAQFLRVMHCFKKEIGSNEGTSKVFRVNRTRVLDALKWLKKYNVLYEDVIIEESNLDWLGGEENDMKHYEKIIIDETREDNVLNDDLGPAQTQTLPLAEAVELDNEVIGVIDESATVTQSENDKEVQSKFRNTEGGRFSEKMSNNYLSISCRDITK